MEQGWGRIKPLNTGYMAGFTRNFSYFCAFAFLRGGDSTRIRTLCIDPAQGADPAAGLESGFTRPNQANFHTHVQTTSVFP